MEKLERCDAVGSEKTLSESHSDADDDDDTEAPDDNYYPMVKKLKINLFALTEFTVHECDRRTD